MRYGIYMRKQSDKHSFMRHCRIAKNRKGLLTAYPIYYSTVEDAEFDAELLQGAGYETKIKEVK